ncbi:MAG: cytochrome c-type biogenesis protein CcmH [Halieaceae bacterium]|nr:cytochrome c-type biogenesis protein CcmH [Halieaceae bacterium]
MSALLLAAPAPAVIETYEFESEALQQRYLKLSAELRCPKCQNQNIADSNAPLAADLRRQLHAQLHTGKTDAEITDYMVQRYGEFVLYRPRWKLQTAPLWLAPILLSVAALALLLMVLRRSRPRVTQPAEDRERLQKLLPTKSEADGRDA